MPGRRGVVAGLLAAGALPAVGQAAPLGENIATLVSFRAAPFPYRGQIPEGGRPFLDVQKGKRRGHTSPRSGVYWEDETYSDSRVLLAVPAGFDPSRPALIVVFFHGNGATLEADVVNRQRVVDQVFASGLNAVLVAPQFAVNALDSSAGSFWQPGAFARFMEEAAGQLAAITGIRGSENVPIVLVAYSGGYNPAAYVLQGGGTDQRFLGVILLDAIFGEADKFARWIVRHAGSAFFVNAYGSVSSDGSAELTKLLERNGISPSEGAPDTLSPGTIALVASRASHDGFVTHAFVDNPVQWLLSRIPGYAR